MTRKGAAVKEGRTFKKILLRKESFLSKNQKRSRGFKHPLSQGVRVRKKYKPCDMLTPRCTEMVELEMSKD